MIVWATRRTSRLIAASGLETTNGMPSLFAPTTSRPS
jgi:hypothetical protein